MQEIARRIAKVAKESKLPVDEDEYVSSFKVELMDAVLQWCRGASFSDVCKVSDLLPKYRSKTLIQIHLALRPIRRKSDQGFQKITGTYSTDDTGCDCYWQHRVGGEVQKGVRNARTPKFRYFLLELVSWMMFHLQINIHFGFHVAIISTCSKLYLHRDVAAIHVYPSNESTFPHATI